MTPDTVLPVTSTGSPKEIVRISEEAKAALVKRAAEEGVPKSDIMRRAIYRELGVETEGGT
jgi:hypothetical protein